MRDQHLNRLIKSLGGKIRTIRKAKKIPLRELSSRTNLSIGALSQIERGILTPSLSSMMHIAHSLEAPMGYFFDPSDIGQTVKPNGLLIKGGEEKLLHSSNGVSVYLLYHDEDFSLEIVKNAFAKSASTGNTKYQHEGVEWGIVLQGILRVELGEEIYILKKGDSIQYNSHIPHRLTNISKGKTVQIWFNSPPLWINKRA